MHLYLVRHGEGHTNLPDHELTNLDEPLTELGQRQVAALVQWLCRFAKTRDMAAPFS